MLAPEFGVWEVEAGGSVEGHHELHREFEDSPGYSLHENLSMEEQGTDS